MPYGCERCPVCYKERDVAGLGICADCLERHPSIVVKEYLRQKVRGFFRWWVQDQGGA